MKEGLKTEASILGTFEERDKKIKAQVISVINFVRDIPQEEIKRKRELLDGFSQEIVEKVNYLKGKYVDADRRRILHVLSGSTMTIPKSEIIEEDFPGDDSVEKFVNGLVEKYIK